MVSEIRGRLSVLAAAFLFSTGGAAIKATTLAAWPVAAIRCAIATAALLALVPDARKAWSWRLVPLSLAYAATLIFFVLATKLTTSANAIFLQAAAPIYLLVLAPLLLHERLGRRDLLLGGAIAAGMALFFFSSTETTATAPNPALGNLFGAASGFAWALTVAGLRKHRDAGIAVVAMGNVAGAVLAIGPALPLAALGFADLGALLYLGIFQIGLAYFCLTRGLRHVPAFEASALMLLEPALNPVWTFVLHGERPGTVALAGGAIILTATLGQALTTRPTATLEDR